MSRKSRDAGSDRAPNLTALRTFDAAARALSFSAAAHELGVTQSAVSHQIRTLEVDLGVKLFHRLTRSLQLTDEGAKYAASVHDAFVQLDRATRKLRSHSQRKILTVNGLPSLAMNFLKPRLHLFNARHPDIVLRLTMSIGPVDFNHDDIDVAIRVGEPGHPKSPVSAADYDLPMVRDWTGIQYDVLMRDVLVPVCSSEFVAKYGPFRRAADLSRVPLIHNSVVSPRSWPRWFEAFNLSYEAANFASSYGHFFLAMEAAAQGLGIALVPDVYVSMGVTIGNLLPLSAFSLETGQAYYLLYRKDQRASDTLQNFHVWLRDECGRAFGIPNASRE